MFRDVGCCRRRSAANSTASISVFATEQMHCWALSAPESLREPPPRQPNEPSHQVLNLLNRKGLLVNHLSVGERITKR